MEEKLIFKSILLGDRNLINNFLEETNAKSYEYTFTSLYLWKDLSNVKYAIYNNTLILLKYEENKGYFFMMPCGYNKSNLQNIVDTLNKYKRYNNHIKYLFGDAESYFINDLCQYTNYNYHMEKDTNDVEYIYLTEDLINLKGRKYHAKRNHCNNFKNLYNYEIKTINSDKIVNDCILLLENWHKINNINSQELKIEISAIENAFSHMDDLNLFSIAIYVDNTLAGFSLGEIWKNTAIIHVERCDIKYKGIYPFIFNCFLKNTFNKTIYTNREEDCGCFGLKKSKESYHPLQLLDKFLIDIK